MPDGSVKFGGAWTPAKDERLKEAFLGDFLPHWRIDSKETGGDTILADVLYESQILIYDTVWDALSQDIHDIKILKSRQLGSSTAIKPLTAFWHGMFDGLQGAMIFDTDAHKLEARQDIENGIKSLPAKYKFPRVVGSNRYGLILEN